MSMGRHTLGCPELYYRPILNPTRKHSDMTMRKQDQKFWAEIKVKYPHHAIAPISIKPHIVAPSMKGDFGSCRQEIGWRIWGFERKEDLKTFKTQFGGRDVV